MSGQWETVKSKKKTNGLKSSSKNEQTKVLENLPKIQEILPLSQVQPLLVQSDIKETKKPGKENNVKERETKKPKKNSSKKKDIAKDKPVLPKILETAVKLINKKEFYRELEAGKASFTDAPLIWMKGLVGYLNTRLAVENVNPVFENKPYDYPQSQLPSDIRETIKKSIADVNPAVCQNLFEWCLTAMANDISRGDKACGAVLGYKLILQLLAFRYPHLAVSSASKVKTLLETYHNQQLIGLSLLWAIGQGGYQDLNIGFHVWREVMFPLMDLRLYSGYVVSYLQGLLSKHPGKQCLQSEFLLPILKLLGNPPDSVPGNRRKELQDLVPILLTRILELPYEKAFLPLFPYLLKLLDDSAPPRFVRELEQMLLTGLLKDKRAVTSWIDTYTKLQPQSVLLLQHLCKNWKKVPKSMCRQFETLLEKFEEANSCLVLTKAKRHLPDHSAQACVQVIEELKRRMVNVHVRSSFPWMRANLLLLAGIGALLTYDIRRHGSLRASTTGHFLHDIGALSYVEEAIISSQHSFRWLKANSPEYYRTASELSRPYLLKVQEILIAGSVYFLDCCQSVYEYAQEKGPVVAEWFEEWAPGLRDRSMELGLQLWEQCKVYSETGSKALIGYGQEAVTWVRTNVFVGSWSPDNIQQYSLAVINATQHYALGTYDWLYEKVQTYSKVE